MIMKTQKYRKIRKKETKTKRRKMKHRETKRSETKKKNVYSLSSSRSHRGLRRRKMVGGNEDDIVMFTKYTLQEKIDYLHRLYANLPYNILVKLAIRISIYKYTVNDEDKIIIKVFNISKNNKYKEDKVNIDRFNVHVYKDQCSYNRLIQITGTCYLNSVLNSLFMPEETSNILIELYFDKNPEVYEELRRTGQLPPNFNKNYVKKSKLFSLQRSTNREPYKLTYEDISQKTRNIRNMGEINLITISKNINHLFFSLVYRKLIMQENIPNGLEILESLGRNIKTYYCLRRTDKLPDSMTVCDYIRDGCAGDSKNSMDALLANITKLENKVEVMSQQIKIDLTNYISKSDYYIIKNPLFPISIKPEGTNMKLVSASFAIRVYYDNEENHYSGHAFNGYICNEIPFLFESNNLIFQDDWVHGDFTHYLKYYINLKKDEKITQFLFDINYLVYVYE